MCGIAGFCTGSGFEGGAASKQAEAMADAITHRGLMIPVSGLIRKPGLHWRTADCPF